MAVDRYSSLLRAFQIRPYVNGALYSILAIPSIREEAKAMVGTSIVSIIIISIIISIIKFGCVCV